MLAEQWRERSALDHASLPGCLQDHLQQVQDRCILNSARHLRQQPGRAACCRSRFARSRSITRVLLWTIASATRADRLLGSSALGGTPYEPSWKSASKIGSRMSLSAPAPRGLGLPAPQGRGPCLLPVLRNLYSPVPLRPIRARDQFVPQLLKKRLDAHDPRSPRT